VLEDYILEGINHKTLVMYLRNLVLWVITVELTLLILVIKQKLQVVKLVL
jgi:hypothetical protein